MFYQWHERPRTPLGVRRPGRQVALQARRTEERRLEPWTRQVY